MVPGLRLKTHDKAQDQREQERQAEVLSKSTEGIVSAGRLLQEHSRYPNQQRNAEQHPGHSPGRQPYSSDGVVAHRRNLPVGNSTDTLLISPLNGVWCPQISRISPDIRYAPRYAPDMPRYASMVSPDMQISRPNEDSSRLSADDVPTSAIYLCTGLDTVTTVLSAELLRV